MPRKTTRLYYGPPNAPLYWTLKVRNATKPVTLNGTVEQAMNGKDGVSIGCHLSYAAMANKSAFPHPVIYVSITKSVALVVTSIKNGQPSECVRYRHDYGKYVDLNDKDPSKAAVKAHPEMFNRKFTLGVYKEQKAHWRPEYGRQETGKRRETMLRGELARMRQVKLVNAVLDM